MRFFYQLKFWFLHTFISSFYISDVLTIEKTSEHFRLIYDVKGRFAVHRITAEEATVSVTFN